MAAPSPVPDLLHQKRLWPVLIVASVLPVMSWAAPFLVAGLNRASHRAPDAQAGWWMYLIPRLLLSALLVWSVWRLRKPSGPRNPRHSQSAQHAQRSQHARTPSENGPRGFDPLMGLRAFAALVVVLGHFFLVVFAYGKPAGTVSRAGFYLLRSCPWAGVWIFFTLSGYLMGKGFASGRYTLTEGGIRSFYRNRLLRIAPLYFAALLLVALLQTPEILLPQNWWQLVQLLIFDFRADLPINCDGALWSISTEVQFYALVPFLFALLLFIRKKLGRRFTLLPALTLIAGASLRHLVLLRTGSIPMPLPGDTPEFTFVYKPLLTNLDLFVAGMSLNLLPSWNAMAWFRRVKTRFPTGWLLGIILVVLFVSTAAAVPANLWFAPLLGARMWFVLPLYTAFLALLFIGVAEARIPPASSGGRPRSAAAVQAGNVIQWAGTVTYAVYVLHMPVFDAVRSAVPADAPVAAHSLALFPFALGAVLLLAHGLYTFVEKPFERKKMLPNEALTDAP